MCRSSKFDRIIFTVFVFGIVNVAMTPASCGDDPFDSKSYVLLSLFFERNTRRPDLSEGIRPDPRDCEFIVIAGVYYRPLKYHSTASLFGTTATQRTKKIEEGGGRLRHNLIFCGSQPSILLIMTNLPKQSLDLSCRIEIEGDEANLGSVGKVLHA